MAESAPAAAENPEESPAVDAAAEGNGDVQAVEDVAPPAEIEAANNNGDGEAPDVGDAPPAVTEPIEASSPVAGTDDAPPATPVAAAAIDGGEEETAATPLPTADSPTAEQREGDGGEQQELDQGEEEQQQQQQQQPEDEQQQQQQGEEGAVNQEENIHELPPPSRGSKPGTALSAGGRPLTSTSNVLAPNAFGFAGVQVDKSALEKIDRPEAMPFDHSGQFLNLQDQNRDDKLDAAEAAWQAAKDRSRFASGGAGAYAASEAMTSDDVGSDGRAGGAESAAGIRPGSAGDAGEDEGEGDVSEMQANVKLLEAYQSRCREYGISARPAVSFALDSAIQNSVGLHSIAIHGNSEGHFLNRLEDVEAMALLEAIISVRSSRVKEIALDHNKLSDVGAACVARFLQDDSQLEVLDLSQNEIGMQGCTRLAKALCTNHTLKELNLSGNSIGDVGGMTLAQMLCQNPSLVSLQLDNTDIGHKTLTLLARALLENNTLEALSIDRPLLFSQQEEALVQIADALTVNTTLRSLSLQKHNMTDRGVHVLCSELLRNTSLTQLNLACNKLTVESATSLAGLLSRSTRITTLNLACNTLSDVGATRLATALPQNKTLTDLNIAYNSINDAGLEAIATALLRQRRMRRLRVWGNKFGPKSSLLFSQVLPQLPLVDCDVLLQVVDGVPHVGYNNNQ